MIFLYKLEKFLRNLEAEVEETLVRIEHDRL
jgi:hypothetical protein